jgi:hypothetical protein
MTKPFNAIWVIAAPWAHPVWHNYAIFLYDLTTEIPNQPRPVKYLHGATHEFLIYAIDPDYTPLMFGKIPLDGPEPPKVEIRVLQPANHGYQFIADSNERAEERLQRIVDYILAGEVSPDSDFTWQWDKLFEDGVTLKQRWQP